MADVAAEVRQQVIRIITGSAEGGLSEADLAQAAGSLPAAGYSSLAYLRMIDTLENTFGIEIDPEGEGTTLQSVDGVVRLVTAHLHESADV